MKPVHLFLILLPLLSFRLYGQEYERMELNAILEIARQKSLDAYKNENIYMASFWEYKTYKSGLLPQASMTLSPFTYSRTVTQRYDVNENIEVFRPQQTLNSYGNLSVNQNIGLTGGVVYVDSDINRLYNFNSDQSQTYNLTPVRLGIIQPIFAFNETKWQHLIEPIKFEQAKQEYILGLQEINIAAVELYFDLILATVSKEIAEQNAQSAAELYVIGQKRFNITSIDKETLLNLELTRQNADIELVSANKEIARAGFNLRSFLRLEAGLNISPVVPDSTLGLQIDITEAVGIAFKSNPELLTLKQQALEADRDLDQTIKDNNISVDLVASFGLNKQADNLDNTFQDLLDQELVAIDISIPLLDWGQRRGQREMALRQKEVVDIEIEQAKIDFEQEVTLMVIDFNLQEQIVSASKNAMEIAKESYGLTEKRFRLGQTEVLNLNASMEARETARQSYVNSLKTYWTYYYQIQKLTLYDFINNRPLVQDFESFNNSDKY